MTGICPLVRLDARLKHKQKSYEKHSFIALALKEEIAIIKSEKNFVYSQLMKGRRFS